MTAPATNERPFEATGGARLGWVNATAPFARLTATSHSLRVHIRLLSDYSFTPDGGPYSLLGVVLTFPASLATLRLPAFQRLVLKPGRHVGEVRPFLKLLLLISGVIAVMMPVTMFVMKATR